MDDQKLVLSICPFPLKPMPIFSFRSYNIEELDLVLIFLWSYYLVQDSDHHNVRLTEYLSLRHINLYGKTPRLILICLNFQMENLGCNQNSNFIVRRVRLRATWN